MTPSPSHHCPVPDFGEAPDTTHLTKFLVRQKTLQCPDCLRHNTYLAEYAPGLPADKADLNMYVHSSASSVDGLSSGRWS